MKNCPFYLLLLASMFAGCTIAGSTNRLPVESRQVIDIQGHSQSKDVAYGLVRQWALRNYNFPEEVVVQADSATGLVVFKEFGVVKRGNGDLISIGYTLTMELADKQVRFIYTIGDPDAPDITTEDDGRQMLQYFDYLKARIVKAIEEDELL